MCNIAGYVGDRPAAPLLIEMLRRQEGLCGGFYTGIATLHEGKIKIESVPVAGAAPGLTAPKFYVSLV